MAIAAQDTKSKTQPKSSPSSSNPASNPQAASTDFETKAFNAEKLRREKASGDLTTAKAEEQQLKTATLRKQAEEAGITPTQRAPIAGQIADSGALGNLLGVEGGLAGLDRRAQSIQSQLSQGLESPRGKALDQYVIGTIAEDKALKEKIQAEKAKGDLGFFEKLAGGALSVLTLGIVGADEAFDPTDDDEVEKMQAQRAFLRKNLFDLAGSTVNAETAGRRDTLKTLLRNVEDKRKMLFDNKVMSSTLKTQQDARASLAIRQQAHEVSLEDIRSNNRTEQATMVANLQRDSAAATEAMRHKFRKELQEGEQKFEGEQLEKELGVRMAAAGAKNKELSDKSKSQLATQGLGRELYTKAFLKAGQQAGLEGISGQLYNGISAFLQKYQGSKAVGRDEMLDNMSRELAPLVAEISKNATSQKSLEAAFAQIAQVQATADLDMRGEAADMDDSNFFRMGSQDISKLVSAIGTKVNLGYEASQLDVTDRLTMGKITETQAIDAWVGQQGLNITDPSGFPLGADESARVLETGMFSDGSPLTDAVIMRKAKLLGVLNNPGSIKRLASIAASNSQKAHRSIATKRVQRVELSGFADTWRKSITDEIRKNAGLKGGGVPRSHGRGGADKGFEEFQTAAGKTKFSRTFLAADSSQIIKVLEKGTAPHLYTFLTPEQKEIAATFQRLGIHNMNDFEMFARRKGAEMQQLSKVQSATRKANKSDADRLKENTKKKK